MVTLTVTTLFAETGDSGGFAECSCSPDQQFGWDVRAEQNVVRVPRMSKTNVLYFASFIKCPKCGTLED